MIYNLMKYLLIKSAAINL